MRSSLGKGTRRGFGRELSVRCLRRLPQDEREGYLARAKAECDEENAEYDAALRRPPDLTPEGIQKVLNNMADFAGQVIQEIHKHTNWHATLIYGGPDPSKGGANLRATFIHWSESHRARSALGKLGRKAFQQSLAVFWRVSADGLFARGLLCGWVAGLRPLYASHDSDSESSDDGAEESEEDCAEDYDDDPFFDRVPVKRTATARQAATKRRKNSNWPRPSCPSPNAPSRLIFLARRQFRCRHARSSGSASPSPSPLAVASAAPSSLPNGDESSEMDVDTESGSVFSFGSAPMLGSSTWSEPTTPLGIHPRRLSPTPSTFSSLAGAVPDIEELARSPAAGASVVVPSFSRPKRFGRWIILGGVLVGCSVDDACGHDLQPSGSALRSDDLGDIPAPPAERPGVSQPVGTVEIQDVSQTAPPKKTQGVSRTAATQPEPEQSLRRSQRNAALEVARPTGPRAACPEDAASWFQARYRQLTETELGLEFDSLISAWVRIESESLFRTCKDKLALDHCPQGLLKWHRAGGKDSPIIPRGRLGAFMNAFRDWWDGLQPSWRKKDVRGRWKRVTYGCGGRQWGRLFTWGDHGFDIIVAGLYMWGCSVEEGSPMHEAWGVALADAIWVFEGIAAHYAEFERGNW
ncbi:hypothetical protein HMN09_01310200 [Mycena chlorophos]|uniref:Uncharacterized protein n=1 Tax=Mycena chlorophos TaxID=658473 RepID=A0A8H6S104_MYCCL|nr:hypothetical protein HMN09_01310200 [Mycena chlorophos]